MNKSKYKIGLALSGGTAKSVAHVGVIKALLENDFVIEFIAGTSGGSIAAVALASGMPIKDIEKIAAQISWRKLAIIRLSRLGFASSRPIEKYIDNLFKGKKLRIEDLTIPCAIPCTDLYSGKNVVFTKGEIAKIVRMSCSLPHFYKPVEQDGRYYIDGGFSEYLPVSSVRDLGAQFAIGVNLGSFDEGNAHFPKYFFELFMQINNLVARQNMQLSKKLADYVIEPDMSQFKSFNFSRNQQVIDYAYEYTLSKVDDIKQTYEDKTRFLAKFRKKINQLGK